MGRVHRQFVEKGDWFFNTWNPDRLEDADAAVLATNPDAWVMHPGESWHGFGDIEDGYCMLDPIKVSVVTPGVAETGGLDASGIPATLVTAYLHHRGIEVEKTTDFTMLFLFSIGVTKGKWGTLLNALLEFKRDYDSNASLAEVLPQVVNAHPDVYRRGPRDPAHQMFDELPRRGRRTGSRKLFNAAGSGDLPADAYQQLARQDRACPAERLAGRVLATVSSISTGNSDVDAGEAGVTTVVIQLPRRALVLGSLPRGFAHDTHEALKTATDVRAAPQIKRHRYRQRVTARSSASRASLTPCGDPRRARRHDRCATRVHDPSRDAPAHMTPKDEPRNRSACSAAVDHLPLPVFITARCVA
jgi:hypothetical protein